MTPTDPPAERPDSQPELAALLRSWRKRALLTQAQLAERTGLSVRTISRLETGRVEARSGSLQLLADALNLSETERPLLIAAAQGQSLVSVPEPADVPVPGQLPPDVTGFVGRAGHLAELDGLVTGADGPGAVVITAIAGAAGVGKTALATHWAHRVGHRFTDGQLYLNLRGYASESPVRPVQALAQLLHGLGVSTDRVPVDEEQAAGLYRSLLAGRRVLIVLDNARDAAQVRPLLPGSPGCLVLVTSRDQLTGLVASHGAKRLIVDVLALQEAVALIGRIAGPDRVAAEPAAARELAEVCGRLPLAVRIAAATFDGQPDRTIAAQVAALRDGDRLNGLAVEGDPETSVRVAFDCSYRVLTPDAQRLFGLLGLIPGPDVSAAGTAALAGITLEHAERELRRLAAAHLVEIRGPGRYGLHDLLREYARQRAHDVHGHAGCEAALQRLLNWYLHTTDAAITVLYPEMLRLTVPDQGLPPAGFHDDAEALDWLDTERASLVAAVTHAAEHGPKPVAWLLADTLRGYFARRRHRVDWLTVTHAAETAAASAGDLQARAAACRSRGHAYWTLSRYQEALQQLTTASALARQAGWTDGQAVSLADIGIVYHDTGHPRRALAHHAQALELDRQTRRLQGQAIALANIGNIHRELGQLAQAADHLVEALALFRKLESRDAEAHVLRNLGEAHRELGQLENAYQHAAQALAMHRQAGNHYGEADALCALAATHRDAGRYAQAFEDAQAALRMACEIGERRVEADVHNVVGSICTQQGDTATALDHNQLALVLAREIGARYPETAALLGLAATHYACKDHDAAITEATQVVLLAREVGYQVLHGYAHTVLAATHLARNCYDQAAEHGRQALSLHRTTGHRLGQAHTLVILGHALHHTDQPDGSATYWEQARELFADIGSPEAQTMGRARAGGTPRTGVSW